MSDALKPFLSVRSVSFLIFAYGLPSAVGLAIWWLFLRPSWAQFLWIDKLSRRIAESGIDGPWLFALGWALLTLSLGLNATFWFRLHEGYYYPSVLKTRRASTHQLYAEHRRLLDLVQESATVNSSNLAAARKNISKRSILTRWRGSPRPLGMLADWRAYPVEPDDYLPTKLGNRIRAFERYGNSRFGLDIIILWYDFANAARGSLLTEIQAAREKVEVFLAACVVAEFLALSSLVPLINHEVREAEHISALSVTGVSATVAAILMYNRAVGEVDEWLRSVGAMVDSCRDSVAKTFGIKLPASTNYEIYAWQMITGYVQYGSADYRARLDEVRNRYPYQELAEVANQITSALERRRTRIFPSSNFWGRRSLVIATKLNKRVENKSRAPVNCE